MLFEQYIAALGQFIIRFISETDSRKYIMQASSLRRRAAEQLTGRGNSAPFLALVGVSLASGKICIYKDYSAI